MKSITKISLGIITLVLVGCSGNPMLQPQMAQALDEQMQHTDSLKDRVTCVEYGTNPNVFTLRQPHCSRWMQDQYKDFAEKISLQIATGSITNYYATHSAKVDNALPTFAEFMEPPVWQNLWNKNAEKWEQELVAQGPNQRKALIAPPISSQVGNLLNNVPKQKKTQIKKVIKAKQALKGKCIQSPICERFPASFACQRIRNVAIQNGLSGRIC